MGHPFSKVGSHGSLDPCGGSSIKVAENGREQEDSEHGQLFKGVLLNLI